MQPLSPSRAGRGARPQTSSCCTAARSGACWLVSTSGSRQGLQKSNRRPALLCLHCSCAIAEVPLLRRLASPCHCSPGFEQAADRSALFKDKRMYRWEYTTCSLLKPGEAVLFAYYNISALDGAGTGHHAFHSAKPAPPTAKARRRRNTTTWATDYWAV